MEICLSVFYSQVNFPLFAYLETIENMLDKIEAFLEDPSDFAQNLVDGIYN